MRHFKNQQTELKDRIDGKLKELDYVDLSRICLNSLPQGGGNLKEINSRLKVLDIFETEKKIYKLEDREYEKLKRCVEDYNWPSPHKDIKKFGEYVTTLKAEEKA